MHQHYISFVVDDYSSDFDFIYWISFSCFKGTVNLLCKILNQLYSIKPHYSHSEPEVVSEAVNDMIDKEWHEEPTDSAHHVSSNNSLI